MKEIFAKYPESRSQSAVMPLLWLAQEQDGENFLSKDKINYISKILALPEVKIYEIVSFYTMYNSKQVGKRHLQICTTPPCYFMGAQHIVKMCENIFGVKKDELTDDGNISFTEVECLGACSQAPVVQVENRQYYTDIKEDEIIPFLSKIAKEAK